MKTNVFLSCSRKCKEKDILKQLFQKYSGSPLTISERVNVFDCEDTPTSIQEVPKQVDINVNEITNSNWFILICPIGWVGQHTYDEFIVAINHNKKYGFPRISIVSCKNSESQREKLEIDHRQPEGTYNIEDLLNEAKTVYSRETKDYVLEYDFLSNEQNHEYDNFEKIVNSEILKVMSGDLFLIKTRTKINIEPKDFFYDGSRILAENGFNADKYVKTAIDDSLIKIVESNTVVIVHGRPASGKSRTVYEFLRNNCEGRIFPVRDSSVLTGIIEEVNRNYEKFQCIRSSVYIVCDQLDTLLRHNEDYYNKIREFSTNLERLNWRLVATCTDLGFENVKKVFSNQDFSFTSIYIPPINEEFLVALKKNGVVYQDAEFNDNMVLGEYILQFQEYQNTIMSNLNNINGEYADLLKNFFRGIQVLKVFRHLDKLPLCLIAMMLNNRHQPLAALKFSDIFRYVLGVLTKQLGIVSLQSNDFNIDQNNPFASYAENNNPFLDIDKIEIDTESVKEYDHEAMITLVDPSVMIMVENDYIFEKIITGEKKVLQESLYVNFNDPEVRMSAMNWFYNTFSEYQAVPTLKRILIRNPITDFKNKYDSNLEQNVNFVGNKLHSSYVKLKSDESFNDLISHWIGRHSSFERIQKVLSSCKNIFTPNLVTVGEILGAAARKSGEQRDKLIKLASEIENSIQFNEGCLPLYIIQRKVDLMKTVDESIEFIESHKKSFESIAAIPESEEKKHAIYDLSKIKKQLIVRIASLKDLDRVIAFMEEYGIEYSHIILLIKQADAFFDWYKKFEYIEKIWEYISDSKNIANNRFDERFISVLYNIIDNSGQYLLARDLYVKGLQYAEDKGIVLSKEEEYKLKSARCNQCRNFEFFNLYNDFFEKGELKDKNISTILRNIILKKVPTFTDTMSLLPKLFDYQNNKPDLYSVIAVSAKVSENGKKQKIKTEFNQSKGKINNDSFENIIQIFKISLFDGIDFSEISLLGSFLANCETSEQVDELKRLMESRRENKFHSKTWDYLVIQPEILSVLINCNHLSMGEARDYINSYITSNSGKNEIFPDPLTAYAKFLWDRRKCQEFNYYKKELKEKINLLWNKMFKDSFFYSSYFRLYPEDWIIEENDTYCISDKLTSLDAQLFDGRIVSSTLIGSLYLSEKKEEREKIYRCVEQWWLDNYLEIKANTTIINEIQNIMGDDFKINICHAKNNHGSKNKEAIKGNTVLSLDQYTEKSGDSNININKIRQEIAKLEKDRFPTISSIHGILRNDRNKLHYSPDQLFEIVDIIFHERNFEVLPSVYSSLLQGIYNYIRYDKELFEERQSKAITAINEHELHNYILENNLILSHLIYILPYDGKELIKQKLQKARMLPYKGIILLTALINKGLKDNNLLENESEFSETVKSIKEYIKLSRLLSKTHGEGSANFLRILLTKYKYPTVDAEAAEAVYLLFDSLSDENMAFLRKSLNGSKGRAKSFLNQCLERTADENRHDFSKIIDCL